MKGTMSAVMQVPDSTDGTHLQLGQLRPKLHRYCARMTGSVIDGEDVVQETLAKALEAFDRTRAVENVEAWLFRIAHNTALDFLRRRARQDAIFVDEELAMTVESGAAPDQHLAAAASLRTLMRLPSVQRSCVILLDVLGYSLKEACEVTGATLAATKAALHRGRARLRELALEPDEAASPVLSDAEERLLKVYVDRFNAHDFDGIRRMIADDAQLELVNNTRMKGRSQVASYFGNYARTQDWVLSRGFVDRRPAVLMRHPDRPAGAPWNFVLLGWDDGRIVTIRDFRYAQYVLADAELIDSR